MNTNQVEKIIELLFTEVNSTDEELAILMEQEIALEAMLKNIKKKKSTLVEFYLNKLQNNEEIKSDVLNFEIISKPKFQVSNNNIFIAWCKDNGYSEKVKEQVAPAAMRSIAIKEKELPKGLTKIEQEELKVTKK